MDTEKETKIEYLIMIITYCLLILVTFCLGLYGLRYIFLSENLNFFCLMSILIGLFFIIVPSLLEFSLSLKIHINNLRLLKSKENTRL